MTQSNPETSIPYHLSEAAPVMLSIYDMTGQQIRTLSLGVQAAGFYQSRSRAAYWDGHNYLGEHVHSIGAPDEADGCCEVSGARCPA